MFCDGIEVECVIIGDSPYTERIRGNEDTGQW